MKIKLATTTMFVLALASTSAYAFDSMEQNYADEHMNKNIKKIDLNHERIKNSNDVVIRDIDLESKTIYKNNIRMKRPIYDIELLKDAIEYEIYIDAQTGEVLKVKQDDD